jgi:putative toxin-antitoxin system antitoxin component (TIGR02293 family)
MAAKSKSRASTGGRSGTAASIGQTKPRAGVALHSYGRTKRIAFSKNLVRSQTRRPGAAYKPGVGVTEFVEKIRHATPLELVEVERSGVGGRLLKDMAKKMDIPTSRLFVMIGVPKATAEKKAASNEPITGAGGQAAIGMVRLLGIAQNIVENSTADVKDFDVSKWLGQWLERPQPSLGGKRPAELLDTPTGLEVVSRLLGAVESGVYL